LEYRGIDTIHRLIKREIIKGVNFGVRLTRVKRSDLENLFAAVEMPNQSWEIPEKLNFEVGNCYTISEISSKFGAANFFGTRFLYSLTIRV